MGYDIDIPKSALWGAIAAMVGYIVKIDLRSRNGLSRKEHERICEKRDDKLTETLQRIENKIDKADNRHEVISGQLQAIGQRISFLEGANEHR